MTRVLDKIKVFSKDRKNVLFLLFFSLGLFSITIYVSNSEKSFDARSRASMSSETVGSSGIVPIEYRKGDLNNDKKVSMEDFSKWLKLYRKFKKNPAILFKSISLGLYHTCGIGSDSKVYCWGYNKYGQLGNDSTTDSKTPVLVKPGAIPSGVTFKSISLGGYHTCGIGSDSKVYCWGRGDFGQLGNDSTTDSKTPVLVKPGAIPSGVTFKSISLGGYHTCGIGSDSKVYCWGRNSYGRLGNDSTTDSKTPVLVKPGAISSGVTFKSISLGLFHTCGIGSDSKVYCWGYNKYGQLGNDSTTDSKTPVLVKPGAIPSGVTFKSISLGGYHTCGIGSDSKVYCWGRGDFGQLGNDSTTDSKTPVLVKPGAISSGVTFKSISLGRYHTCGIGSDSKVYCWGKNEQGQLGNDSTTDSKAPVLVKPGAIPSGVTFKSISLGGYHTCGIGSDSKVYCWGRGDFGQLGNDSTTDSKVPNLEAVQEASLLEADMDSDSKVTMTDFSLWLGIYRKYKATKTAGSKGVYWSLDDAKLNDGMKVFPLKSVGGQQLELVQGKKGKGVKFSGKRGYRLEYKNSNPDLFKQQNLTVMAYIKLSEGACGFNGHCAVISKGSSNNQGFLLTIKNNKPEFYINDSPEETSKAFGSTTLQKNIWYHIAGTYNKSDGKLNVYVNGVLDGSATNPGPIKYGNADFWIGNANNNIDLQFNGVIDEVRFFDRVLTKSEIGSYVLK